MKKQFLLIFVVMLGISALMNSCATDPCKDKTAAVLCNDKGDLVDKNGTCGCNCDSGYEGTDCKTLTITSLVGEWKLGSSAVLGTESNVRTGKTTITQEGTSVTKVKITNLNQFFACSNGGTLTDVICYANINGEVVLDETAQCGVVFKGKGSKQTDGSWKFVYTAIKDGKTYNCESILSK
ncbi:MAG: hypothetical protein MUE53_10140 [Chitinophagales bacterium]|jgi:hypothetical protein|nr:hypothetical protein [Chitinophagales bacterium]